MVALEASAPASAAAAASTAVIATFGPIPPVEVIAWACIGGLVAVWLARRDTVAITGAWLFGTVMLFAVSVIAGIVLSAGVLSLAHAGAPGFSVFAAVPHWVAAASCAGGVHWFAPLVLGWLRARVGAPEDGRAR